MSSFKFLCQIMPLLLYCSESKAVSPSTIQNFKHLGTFYARTTSGPSSNNYFISNYELSANNALLECHRIYSAKLLDIHTREEDEFVRLRLQMLGLEREQIHTSGKFNSETGKWEWSTTGRPTVYANWKTPPKDLDDTCIQLTGSLSSYGWIDDLCSIEHLFICKSTLWIQLLYHVSIIFKI